MKNALIGVASSAAVVAFLCATPAMALGGDANAEADQAQLHPWSTNQTPDWSPNDVAIGELYPRVPGADAFYGPNGERPLGSMAVVIRSCPIVLDTTNGRETVVCAY